MSPGNWTSSITPFKLYPTTTHLSALCLNTHTVGQVCDTDLYISTKPDQYPQCPVAHQQHLCAYPSGGVAHLAGSLFTASAQWVTTCSEVTSGQAVIRFDQPLMLNLCLVHIRVTILIIGTCEWLWLSLFSAGVASQTTSPGRVWNMALVSVTICKWS